MSFNMRDKVAGDTAMLGASTRELAERLVAVTIAVKHRDRIEIVEVLDGDTDDETIHRAIAAFEDGIIAPISPVDVDEEDE